LNPDCLLVKSDINFNELLNAIETVTMEAPYYSKTVIRYMRQRIVSKIIIDQTDKAILYYLSKGIKIKDLPRFINLSKSTIELRKRKLKDVFEVEDQGDYHLLQQASEQGFI
jgi:DNA-binding NarL/FixJ family response regulator